jgi:hypothetical protein
VFTPYAVGGQKIGGNDEKLNINHGWTRIWVRDPARPVGRGIIVRGIESGTALTPKYSPDNHSLD